MFIFTRAIHAWVIVAAVAFVSAISVASAGPGHNHGSKSAGPAGPSSPRVVAVSEKFELVGIHSEGKLTVYLDRMEDTSPVTDAQLEVTIDGATGIAEPQPDGTYAVDVPTLDNKLGDHEVIVTIVEQSRSDLLIGTLKNLHSEYGNEHDDLTASHADDDHAAGQSSAQTAKHPSQLSPVITKSLQYLGLSGETMSRKFLNSPVLAGFGLALGILLGALARRRTGLIVGLVCVVSVFGAGVAWAGPGHDHGEGSASAASGDAPRRLSDGELFLPKPTQRLLDIRTRVLKSEVARTRTNLIGRVISDPNHSGLVQSTIGGRMKAPEGGFPILGQRVEAGQVLAFVEPAFAPIDASDVRQTAGDLEQRIAVLKAKIARQRRLVDKKVASAASLEDLEIELGGLQARRLQLTKSRSEPEVLTAPADGVIAEVRVVAGQVVASSDTLFHVVDPKRLWVEAIAFDPRLGIKATTASARTADGEVFALTFVGRSRALQQQATVLQFRIGNPTNALSIGSPVKVQVETGDPIAGLIVPRSAIAQAPNGQMVTFKRLEPERYLPQAVRFDDVDAVSVRITGGLKPGDQIIVRNAPLVNQIR